VSSAGDYGRASEARAAAFLRSRGLRILQQNLRGPSGEIDIVALDGATLVFVEVKARRSARFGPALAAVDARKRRRLRNAAADYLQFVDAVRVRFDVVTIEGDALHLHRGAFA